MITSTRTSSRTICSGDNMTDEKQVDVQKVIESLLRQIADLAGKVAMLEAMLAQTSEAETSEP